MRARNDWEKVDASARPGNIPDPRSTADSQYTDQQIFLFLFEQPNNSGLSLNKTLLNKQCSRGPTIWIVQQTIPEDHEVTGFWLSECPIFLSIQSDSVKFSP